MDIRTPPLTPDEDADVVVFVGGCERSGTTLAGRILAEQLSLVALPEAYFHAVAYRRFGAAVASSTAVRHWRRRSWAIDQRTVGRRETLSSFLRMQMRTLHDERRGSGGSMRVVESTPENIEIGSTLLEEFPDAHLVHLVRDPRAVAASLRKVDFGPRTAQECARLWKQRIASGLALEQLHPGRVHRIRYEDLLVNPRESGRLRWCVGLGKNDFVAERDLMTEFSSESLQERSRGPAEISRVWAWRSLLTPRQIGAIEYECRELMTLFGYRLEGVPDSRPAAKRRLNTLFSAADELTVGLARRAVRVGAAVTTRRSRNATPRHRGEASGL